MYGVPRPRLSPAAFTSLLLALATLTACAGRRAPATAALQGATEPASEAQGPPPAQVAAPVAPAPAAPAGESAAPGGGVGLRVDAGSQPAPGATRAAEPSLRELCRRSAGESGILDESRRLLSETFCDATLWFDGLFGDAPDVRNARAVSGRVELSTLHTDFQGYDVRPRLHLNYELPNLERRVRFVIGRDDRTDVTADRREGFAIRSAVFGLQDQDEWLAGLGYSPPGRFFKRLEFGVGGRLKTAPEVFAHARYRRNVFVGDRDDWRFRETVFWENRDGLGSTTSLDWDHVLQHDLLLRWGTVGTTSQGTDGLEWRSAMVLYQNLRQARAIAGELFLRGATRAEVPLREYGARAIYRQPLGVEYLFGDLIVGYTWPREERDKPRNGSMMVGLSLELLFGQEPY